MNQAGTQAVIGFRRIMREVGKWATSIHDEGERRECDSVLIALDHVRKLAADSGVKIGEADLVQAFESATGQRAQLRFAQLVYNARSRHMVRRSQDPKRLVDECIQAMEAVG